MAVFLKPWNIARQAVLADEGNVEELGEYIRLLMHDEQLWQQMSTAGRDRVSPRSLTESVRWHCWKIFMGKP